MIRNSLQHTSSLFKKEMLFELKYEKWLEMADEEELMVGVESRESVSGSFTQCWETGDKLLEIRYHLGVFRSINTYVFAFIFYI